MSVQQPDNATTGKNILKTEEVIPSCKFHSPRSSEVLSRLHSILHVLPLHHNIHPTQKQRSKHEISLWQMLPGTPVTFAVCLLKYWLKWYMEGPWLFLFLPYWYQNIASDICYLHVIKILVPWEVTRPESTLVPMYVSELWLLTTCGYASFFFVSPRWKKNTEPIGILIIMKKSCATMNCHK
jgi:hypothetical protein